jgi:flagellar secretion chaperone FliS
MNVAVQNEYLVTEVMTATPQKLHLMLVEAAIRSVLKAKKLREQKANDEAGEAIVRTQEIVAQLIAGINPDPAAAVARRLASVYNFIFRALVQAHVQTTSKGLDEALRVLIAERETWQQACARFGSTQAQSTQLSPHLGGRGAMDPAASAGMSFEA